MSDMICTACLVAKPTHEFAMEGERQRKQCRECMRAKRRTPKRRALRNAMMRKAQSKAARNASVRKRQGLESVRISQRKKSKRQAAKYPEKAKVKRLVRSAIEAGHLIRPLACGLCNTIPKPARGGRTAIHAHHPDYTKPLEIQWLCQQCHTNVHQREAA